MLETLGSDAALTDICRREGLSPNLAYLWRKTLTRSTPLIFARKPRGPNAVDPKLAKIAAENSRMKSVIVKLTAEDLDLEKYALGLSDHPQLPPELQQQMIQGVQQTRHLDRWDSRGVTFLFGIDAMRNLIERTNELPKSAWMTLECRRKREVQTQPRAWPGNVEERIVVEKGYENIKLAA